MYKFGVNEIDFLGHQVNQQGVFPLPEKVDAVCSFPRPTTVKQLQEYLGMASFYHRFVPSAAALMQPLYKTINMKCKLLVWTSELDPAFKQSKEALAKATMLVHPGHEAPTSLTVDASDVVVGAVLELLIDGVWKPLAFFTHQLHPPERMYSAFDNELLALYLAVCHFHYFLEARSFIVYTDHKPLTTDVIHIAGKDNSVADALSHIPVHIGPAQVGVDCTAMANPQQNNEEMKAYHTAITGLVLEDVKFRPTNSTLLCDISSGLSRPIVPSSWCRKVYEVVPNLSHSSIQVMHTLITKKFMWHVINKQVGVWAKVCNACQTSKVHRHVKAPPRAFKVPSCHFDHINVDLVGPISRLHLPLHYRQLIHLLA